MGDSEMVKVSMDDIYAGLRERGYVIGSPTQKSDGMVELPLTAIDEREPPIHLVLDNKGNRYLTGSGKLYESVKSDLTVIVRNRGGRVQEIDIAKVPSLEILAEMFDRRRLASPLDASFGRM